MVQFDEKYRKCGDISLSDEQVEGINFMLSRKNSILAFQTGMGKTLTSLVTAKILLDSFDSVRVVFVVPVKAKKAFKKEMFQRLNFKRSDVGIIATDEHEFDIYTNKIFLITDTNIKLYPDTVKDIADLGYKVVLFIDEAHKLADGNTSFYQTMQEVNKSATMCIEITATPLINSLDGLYSLVDFIYPKFFGTKTRFYDDYVIYHLEDVYIKGQHGKKRKTRVIDGYKNLDKLQERLNQIMIVRGKQYDIKFNRQFEDLTDDEHKIYEKVSSGLLSGVTTEERNFSKRMHDLQRFLDRAYDADDELKELVSEYGASNYSTKEEILIKTLKLALSKNYSLIVYASYKETIKRLHNVLKSRRVELGLGRIYEITGSVNIKEREEIEDRIQPNDVVLITSAGTESINLQRCNCVILYDIPFSCKEVVQLVGRITRVDTKHNSQYVIFCGTKGTIDEYKYLLFQQHLDVVQRAINVGTHIPLEDIQVDQKLIKQLREQLLWKYKGDPLTKKLRKEKRDLKKQILTSTLEESKNIIAANKFLIEPLNITGYSDVKEVKVLYPNTDKYNKYIAGVIPYTVLRSDYLQFLKSEKGVDLLNKLREGIKSSGNLLLVGETKLPEVLKDSILNNII